MTPIVYLRRARVEPRSRRDSSGRVAAPPRLRRRRNGDESRQGTDYPRRSRGAAAARPRNIHVAAAASPRLVSAEYPRDSRGVATTRPRTMRAAKVRQRASRGPRQRSLAPRQRLRAAAARTIRVSNGRDASPDRSYRNGPLGTVYTVKMPGKGGSKAVQPHPDNPTRFARFYILNRANATNFLRSRLGRIFANMNLSAPKRSIIVNGERVYGRRIVGARDRNQRAP